MNNENDKLICPHCGYEYDEPVKDFVIPTNFSKDPSKCDECDRTFYVKQDRANPTCFAVTTQSATALADNSP